ncbi:MAG: ABC transporter permease [Bacteroidetes bacterium]|nr:ABC transporter permease [Bacteroidota bacterium]
MAFSSSIISTSITQALGELRNNRLRTTLSLLGIAIGIFCIVAVKAVLNSMEEKIRENMSSLGSDVLYISRRPWMPEGGEYKWWEYLKRRPLGLTELRAIQHQVPAAEIATICYAQPSVTLKAGDESLDGVTVYAVLPGFEKMQQVDIDKGRFLSAAALETGSQDAVIGHGVYESLFGGRTALGKSIKLEGRGFNVVGQLRKEGQNMAGFDFDNSIIISYATASAMYDVHAQAWSNDPNIMVKAKRGVSVNELEDEVTGMLRALRKVRPGAPANFSVNRLSEVSERLTEVFGVVNVIGGVIGLFSLLVGAFGIANIMFVTVRERTKVIGLKKAIGARRSVILTEFLVEAVTLCIIGGAMGILLVYLLSLGLSHAADFPVRLSIENIGFGVGISALVGIVAGLVPAITASRLNPVVAIRST